MTGGGSDWWEDGEKGHFLYKQLTGSFRLEANVTVIGDPPEDWAKFGVAYRNTIDTGAGHLQDVSAFVAVTDPNRTSPLGAFQGRTVAGASAMYNLDRSGAQPSRVALQRTQVGAPGGWYVVEGFIDTGSGWSKLGQRYQQMTDAGYAGLVATSHKNDPGTTATADFTNVAFTSPVAAVAEAAAVVPAAGNGGVGYFDVTEVVNSAQTLPGSPGRSPRRSRP